MLAPALQVLALIAAAVAAPQRHPQPRVVVDVQQVDGPHERADVEREARSFLWGKIIKCYRAGAADKPKLKGDATFAMRVGSDGDVTRVRSTGATLADAGVIACWAREIEQVPMPRAAAASNVLLQVHVAPGDPPRSANHAAVE
jgi:hypothetical protein